MHRSGTSLVAKVLEKGGIFMGVIKDHNYEAIHFLSLNQQTLWAAGASWLEPQVPDKVHWKSIPSKDLFEEHFKITTIWQRLRYRLAPVKWGWKDPRNTFTLPMWLHLFPNAKVIHVTRKMEDVATSLQRRNKVEGEVFDKRLDNYDHNLALAQKYLEQGRSYRSEFGKNYLEISYEQILNLDPYALSDLEKFTGVKLVHLFKEYIHSSG